MDKQIEEVFEKYGRPMIVVDGREGNTIQRTVVHGKIWLLNTLNKALQNGDLFTKEQVERAKLEGKIEVLKSVYKKYSADLGYSMPEFVKDYYEELELKLKELN